MKTQNKGQFKEAIIFARVATYHQIEVGEMSISSQIKKAEDYCKEKGFTVIGQISEVCSGHKRNMLCKLLDMVRGRKNKVIVCCDSIDRFSRNIFDKIVAMLYEMAVADKIELHFIADKQVIDSTMNADDKFSFGMKLGLSKYYSDAISHSVKRALDQKRQNGELTNKAPFGYLNVKDMDGKATVIVDAKNKELIKMIFKLHDKEVSIGDIHKKLREIYPNDSFETKRRMDNAFIYRVIRNKDFYSGYINHDGKKYPHKYERIITLKK